MVGLQDCRFHDWHSYPIAGPSFNASHKHGILPGLSWVSNDDEKQISRAIAEQVDTSCWLCVGYADEWDEALVSQIRNFDFRYIRTDNLDNDWVQFLNKLWKTVR